MTPWKVHILSRYVAFGLMSLLGISIGVGVTAWSVLRTVVLQPLSFEAPHELVWVRTLLADQRASPADILYSDAAIGLRENAADVLDVAAVRVWDDGFALDLTHGGVTQRLDGAEATPGLFALLGLSASLGSVHNLDATRGPVAVLSAGLWRREFGADPAIVGTTLTLASDVRGRRVRESVPVAAVLSPARSMTPPLDVELWIVRPWESLEADRGHLAYRVIGRMTSGVTLQQARDRVRSLYDALFPADMAGRGSTKFLLVPVLEALIQDVRPTVVAIAALAGLLVLATVGTIANAVLMAVRARAPVLAVHAALGASTGQLIGIPIVAVARLAVIGGLIGVGLCPALIAVVKQIAPATLPRTAALHVDLWALGMAGLVTVGTILLAAAGPASYVLRQSRYTADLLRTRSPRSGRALRDGVLALQAALIAAILTVGWILIDDYRQSLNVSLGYRTKGVVTFELPLREPAYVSSEPARSRFLADFRSRAQALPGVRAVALTSGLPIRDYPRRRSIDVAECPLPIPHCQRGRLSAVFLVVDPAYFDVFGIPAETGRLLQSADRSGTPRVAMVSSRFARVVWPGQAAIGRTLTIESDGQAQQYAIVGVARDVFDRGPDPNQTSSPAVYVPAEQQGLSGARVALLVDDRWAGPAALRQAIAELDPFVTPVGISGMEELVAGATSGRRFYFWIALAFGWIGLIVGTAALSIVVRRTALEKREDLALRYALGASRRHLVATAAGSTLLAVGSGSILGIAAALYVLELFLVKSGSPAAAVLIASTLMALSVAVSLSSPELRLGLGCYKYLSRGRGAEPFDSGLTR